MLPEARRDKLLVKEIGDQLVIYDRSRHRAHRLNRTAAFVWRHCDGRTGVAELARLLGVAVDAPMDERVVGLALTQLDKAGLLRRAIRSSAEPVSASRREIVKQLGLAGALALLLPVVTSIAAPTPLMAQYLAPACAAPNVCRPELECLNNNLPAHRCPTGMICCKS